MFTANKGYAITVGESPWQEWQSHGVDVLNAIIGATDTPHLRHALTSRGGQSASERIGPYVLVRHHIRCCSLAPDDADRILYANAPALLGSS